ncbi:MAG: acyl-CoA dehydrogenase [Pseudomonadaceae bacterium]|nr:acyl-CoA dehydrogenase [Pseudomonadaceae bacterium]
MDFNFSDEQTLLGESVERFVQDNYDLETRIKLANSKEGFSSDYWNTMAELGWFGMPFSEADGGFGGNQIDTMVMMEAFGKGLVLEPFFASIVLGGNALARAGSEEQKAAHLPSVIDGSKRLTLAYAEEQARFDLFDVTTTGKLSGDTLTINGAKSMVPSAGAADTFVVSVRTSGGQMDKNGISLVLVDASADGVSVDDFPTVDGLRAGEVTFTNVEVPAGNVLGEPDNGFDVLSAVARDAILALSAEALGAMEILYKDTIEYTQEREQFDHALSDFQVLQHRMVDMFVEYEQCKSLLYRATLEVVQGADTADRTVHALKHLIGKAGYFIGENAVQLHGGMGMTEELRVGHFFKRLVVLDTQFGNADHHLEQFAA